MIDKPDLTLDLFAFQLSHDIFSWSGPLTYPTEENPTARKIHAFRFSCEAAMRAGEVIGMSWEDIDLDARVVHLPKTKNGRPRDVPLSGAAIGLLKQLPALSPVFGLNSSLLDALFHKIKTRALVEGLTYRNSRPAALTMLSHKVDVMTLAKIKGHRDLRILMNTYHHETAVDVAKRL
jgi:integrase